MRRAWTRWQALGFHEKRCLLSMFVLLPLISAMLHIFGFRRSHDWLLKSSQKPAYATADSKAIAVSERLAYLANIAGRRGAITATCLRQAMLLQWWLRRRGLDAKLKLGARLQEGQFDAHAWVELEGIALGQTEMNHRAFPEFRDN